MKIEQCKTCGWELHLWLWFCPNKECMRLDDLKKARITKILESILIFLRVILIIAITYILYKNI